MKPTVIGGGTIGYDFVNAGFGAYAFPDWMKYFSFALDLTYNRLDSRAGEGLFDIAIPLGESGTLGKVTGSEVALTFLFMAHYGFLPDSEVPGGRINPYIGVGPAIVWTSINFKRYNHAGVDHPAFGEQLGARAMNVALVVEPGIRWVCFKNVSIDTAMRYRLSQPSWTLNNDRGTVEARPLNQIAFLLRANYHF